jgi:erythronate-4-phosphate dehydrogenase
MNIHYDENMPFAREFFGELGHLIPFSGRELHAENVKEADVLLVRSITKVNESLLSKNKKLSFVGTATIGVDHIDQNYLADRNITFTAAPGCNAISVAEYVISSLVVMAERYQLDIFSFTVGIVGAGNTGTRLSEKLDALGIQYVLCDPLLKTTNDSREFVALEQALACDVISLHVPITDKGDHATYHLLDQARLSKLSDEQILINACRGEVIDNSALLALKAQGLKTKLILDVWENEPEILLPLIEHTEISTAHIAGYSLEGKARGTEMLYQALCEKLGIPVTLSLESFLPVSAIEHVKINEKIDNPLLNALVKVVYDVRRDDAIFKQQLVAKGFDHLRKTYPIRREFSSVNVSSLNNAKNSVACKLGFGYYSS